jgi:hypothetical protein
VLRNDVTALNQLIATSGEHIVPGTPTASATKALLRLGNALVGGDADGCYLGLNAPSGWVGDYLRLQLNAVDVLRLDSLGNLGVGVSATSGFRIHAEADGNFDNMVRVNNVNTGNGAAAGSSVQVRCGGTDTASGRLTAWGGSHASTFRANRVSVVANSDATGVTLEANNASQDIRFVLPTPLDEQARFASTGELLIGTTSTLGRLAVVGRIDQIQSVVRAFSTQTTNLAEWQSSAPAILVAILGDGRLQVNPATNALAFFGGTGSINNTRVSIFNNQNATLIPLGIRAHASQTASALEVQDNGGTSRVTVGSLTQVASITLAVRGIASQTGKLQEWQTSAGGTLAYVQADGPCYFPQAGIGVFAAQAGVGLFVTGSDATAVTQVLRQLTSQTGHLLEARDDSNGSLFTFTNIGDLTFNRRSSTTGGRQVADLIAEFVVSTDASRTGRFKLRATDFNATREVLRGEADGTNPMVGFLGTNAFRATGWATATGTATRTTFDTTTVTLAGLAERVKALLDDLHQTAGYGLLRT